MNKDEKTLVILTPGFPDSETDYNCLPMLQSFVRSLKKNHPQLNIIVLSFQYPYFKKEYDWYGNKVISFSGKNSRKFSKLLLRKKIFSKLNEIKRSHRISSLLSFWCSECAWVGKKFADKNGLKHFCWILGQDAKKENNYIKKINPRPGELIALSDFLQEEFEKNHSIRPAHVIPPGIETEQFSEKKLQKDIDVLGAGSLIPLKQYDIFIEVIHELKKYIPEIKVVLCGQGPEENKLKSLRHTLGLEENVLMTGEISHHQVLLLMQRSKILLHPSSYEGFGVVCLEASYSGAHVIRFSKAMNKKIDQWHIVNTKEEMFKKTLEILQDQDTPYKRVLVYDMDEIANRMMQLISN